MSELVKIWRTSCSKFGRKPTCPSWQGSARNLPGTYQKHIRNQPETYQEPTRNLPETYQEPARDLPGTYQKPTRNIQNSMKNNTNMVPKILKNRPQNQPKSSKNDPRGAPGERSWNLPRGIGKKTSIWSRFWSLLGSPGASLGDPGGSHFRPWTLPGRPQGAREANFKPSWANPVLDADSGPQKSQKKLNFEGARTLKIELALARERNFHNFASFLSEP